MADWELIIIDDGSDAATARICDEIAQTDNRIAVVHKQNEGVSIARNMGLSLAKGEFISFIDSDDWVEPTFLEEMRKAMTEDVDIVIIDSTTIYKNGRTESDEIVSLKAGVSTKSQLLPHILVETAGGPCRCLYRKEIIVDNNIRFPDGLKFSEDRIFNIKAMGCSRAIYYLKRPLYCRYMREGSAVGSFYPEMAEIIKRARALTREALNLYWRPFKEYAAAYENQTMGLYYAAINNLWGGKAKLPIRERIDKTKEIVNDQTLRDAIATVGDTSIRARLIKSHSIYLLSLFTLLINLKHRIWR